MRCEQDFLVHQHKTAMFRIDGTGEGHVLPIHRNRAAGRLQMAAQKLHQRRLAGTVLADDCMHLAGLDGEADIGQHLHRPESLGDAPGFKHGQQS